MHTSKTCFPEQETVFLPYALEELYLLSHLTKLNTSYLILNVGLMVFTLKKIIIFSNEKKKINLSVLFLRGCLGY